MREREREGEREETVSALHTVCLWLSYITQIAVRVLRPSYASFSLARSLPQSTFIAFGGGEANLNGDRNNS